MFLKKIGINILSLFDGMSCGRVALERAGISVNKYYASEIDKYATQVSQNNYPDIIRLGDVTKWKEWNIDFASIDLIIAGSPCQGFSFAGKQLAFDDPRSKLFFVFVDILNHVKSINPNVKFLLENVRMKKEYEEVITRILNVDPVMINSALVSAQNRKRLYWCNWNLDQPKDRNIYWGDVREKGISENKYYYTDKAMQWLAGHSRKNNKILHVHTNNEKMQMIEASHYKKYSAQRFFGVVDFPICNQAIAALRGRHVIDGVRKDLVIGLKGNTKQFIEFRFDNKTNSLTTVGKDNVIVPFTLPNRIEVNDFFFRYVTPIECERLQTLPDNYTAGVSDSQRYKMLGNGWTVDVIAHIFTALKQALELKDVA